LEYIVWKTEKVFISNLGLYIDLIRFQLIQTLKADYPGADPAKRLASLPSKNRLSGPKPGTSGSVSSIQTRSNTAATDVQAIEIPKSSLQKHSRSMVDTEDEDQDDAPQQYRKLARSMAASPKPSKANLNAYGMPMNSAALQKTKSMGDLADRIRVCVRKRPLSKKELKRGETDNTKVLGRRTIAILEPKYN
jgi:hypothetical protein